MLVISIILSIVIIYLIWRLKQQQNIDQDELQRYLNNLAQTKEQLQAVSVELNATQWKKDYLDNEIKRLEKEYEQRDQNLDQYFDQQKAQRQQQLENDFKQRYKDKQQAYKATLKNYDNKVAAAAETATHLADEYDKLTNQLNQDIADAQNKFNAILEPLQQYEKEQQDKLFYAVQIPEEYQPDINYLLVNIAPQLRHPDIISKLIWTEYVRPYLDATCKRVGIDNRPGIYKITNINDKKAYIGKSTDMKKRIAEHYKSSVGIKSIADQAIHHAMLQQGLWNWTIEPIIYCEKQKLNELEKFYIDFFKTQEYGYNRRDGG